MLSHLYRQHSVAGLTLCSVNITVLVIPPHRFGITKTKVDIIG